MLICLYTIFIYLFLRYPRLLKKKIDRADNKASNTENITSKNGLFKLVVTAFLVCLTLSLFLTSISYALPGRAGVGGGFPTQSPPLGLQRPNNAGSGNNLGAFSNTERSPALPNTGSPPGGPPILHPSTNGGSPPAALGGLMQQQQQHQQSLFNAPPSNTKNVVNPNGCPTVVQPNGANTKVVHPSNCSLPSNSVVHTPNNSPTDSRLIHANNNCAAVIHPNGADTKVASSNNCPANTSGHVTVNSGSTSSSSSSSSSLTVNNVQGSNSGASKSSSTNTNTNAIPIADAGPNQKVHTSDRVILDGSKSSDPSGGSLKFSWLQLTGGQVISLSNQDKAKATFVAPTVTAPTVLTFQLIVNNGNAYSAPSYVAVTVLP
jgi:hypothetical protein